MKIEDIVAVLETAQANQLNSVQELVLHRVWQGQTYAQIAEQTGYNTDYIKSVGSQLWRSLSESLGEPVSKRNFRAILQQRLAELSVGAALRHPIAAPASRQDWGDAIDTSYFVGRIDELTALNQWVVQDRCRLVSILAMGGVGKTALAIRCAEQIQDDFDFLIWRSLRNAPSVDDLLDNLLEFFAPGQAADLPAQTHGKLSRLMGYLRQHRCLLIMDNWESILESNHTLEHHQTTIGVGRYRQGYEGFGQLLRLISEEKHQSCLLLTSREKPIGLSAKEGDQLPIRSLKLKGLGFAEARDICRITGISGSDFACKQLVERYSGNILALKIAATVIRELFDRDTARFLAQDTLIWGEIGDLLDQQMARLSTLEQTVLHYLSRCPNGCSLGQLQKELQKDMSSQQLLEALNDLQWRSLVERRAAQFILPNLLLDYFGSLDNARLAIAG